MIRFEEADFTTIFTEAELCLKLGGSKSTLAKWRSQGKAPPSNKKGRMRFYWNVEHWIKSEKMQSPRTAKQPNPTIESLPMARKVVPIGSFHMRRSKGKPKTDSSSKSCPKCLSNGQVFRSGFQMLDAFALLFALKAVRRAQCMHRFYGKPKNAGFLSRSAGEEPARMAPEEEPTLRGPQHALPFQA